VAFSEKWTKISRQTHIQKFEILDFSNTISVKSQWFRIFSVLKSVPHQSKRKVALWNQFQSEISRISNFLMWVWGLNFVLFSKKVTCTAFLRFWVCPVTEKSYVHFHRSWSIQHQTFWVLRKWYERIFFYYQGQWNYKNNSQN